MLKIYSKLTIAAMVVALGVSIPARYAPAMAAGETRYISEVKVGMDKTEAGAVKELLEEGFTILSKDGKYADLNEDAGSKDPTMGRGQKKVYLGYKITNDPTQAITDLAVMNMRGGYSIRDYESLMETRLKTEILPFIERFLATLQEYRTNLQSEYPANKARATYMKSMLNKLKDDDTGGLLGDLLVNETKYELGDTAYNALSIEEKKQHADIATIVMQANGKNMLTMETLLTKATDTAETSWIERLEDNSLEALEDELIDQGVDITEVDATLDKTYEDSAKQLLEKWDVFNHALLDYDNKANELLNFKEQEYEEKIDSMEKYNDNKELNENGESIAAEVVTSCEMSNDTLDLELVAAKERMDEIDYDFDDGTTLAEFFMQDASAFNGDGIRNLYPIVASLSAGQLAGLDFLSLQDLVTIATADATSYEANELGDIEPVSIFEGVNREIFEKGKVALTNKALRAEAMKNDAVVDSPLSATTYVLWGATAVATAGMIASWVIGAPYAKTFEMLSSAKDAVKTINLKFSDKLWDLMHDKVSKAFESSYRDALLETRMEMLEEVVGKEYAGDCTYTYDKTVSQLATKSKICTYLGAAFTVAMAALAVYSIISTVQELQAYYQVEYTPIPKYIVEETKITEEVNGKTVVKRNDSAYYRVAECNRKSDTPYYEQLQNYADLNGDVGKEWLALYYVREDGHAPIKADSLLVVKGTSNIPTGYSNLGIHNFETENAYNLTSAYYCYNDTPKGTYVYFQVDESALPKASVAGSNFSTGTGFLFAGIGAVVGAGIGIAIMLIISKRKEMKVSE